MNIHVVPHQGKRDFAKIVGALRLLSQHYDRVVLYARADRSAFAREILGDAPWLALVTAPNGPALLAAARLAYSDKDDVVPLGQHQQSLAAKVSNPRYLSLLAASAAPDIPPPRGSAAAFARDLGHAPAAADAHFDLPLDVDSAPLAAESASHYTIFAAGLSAAARAAVRERAPHGALVLCPEYNWHVLGDPRHSLAQRFVDRALPVYRDTLLRADELVLGDCVFRDLVSPLRAAGRLAATSVTFTA